MTQPVLEIRNLAVSFSVPQGEVQAVRGICLTVHAGEILCVVGESGCGKTAMCQSVMRLLPRNGRIREGQILICGKDVTRAPERELRRLRGSTVSMVFQDPLSTLNPTLPVGRQITEAILLHEKVSREEAMRRALELMELVGIDHAAQRFSLPPHTFSGGMRQRCVLAVSLAAHPKLLLADEPTTALDATVGTRILDLLLEIRNRTGIAIVLITHDLGVVARVADRVAVMYAGRVVETGTAQEVLLDPRHPYTWGMLSSLPSMATPQGELVPIPGMPPPLLDPPPGDAFAERNPYALAIDYEQMPPMFPVSPTHGAATWLLDPRAPRVTPPLLRTASPAPVRPSASAQVHEGPCLVEVRSLTQRLPAGSGMTVTAVDGLTLGIHPGEVFALVGESGCGKTTTARALAGIYSPTSGEILYEGIPVSGKGASWEQRRRMQRETGLILQDAAASLNPRMTVEKLISESLHIRRMPSRREEILGMMQRVGLDDTCLSRCVGELSGGQCQRVAIARCLITRPRLVIADEPVSSLDISIQAQIIMLFRHLQREHHFAFLLISHDLSMVRFISDRTGVMLQGRLVEVAPTEELFSHPLHPYTRSLLSAVRVPDPLLERSRQVLPFDFLSPPGTHLTEASPGHFVLR